MSRHVGIRAAGDLRADPDGAAADSVGRVVDGSRMLAVALKCRDHASDGRDALAEITRSGAAAGQSSAAHPVR